MAASDDDVTPERETTNEDAVTTESANKRRRLSRREQKARKKTKKTNGVIASATATIATTVRSEQVEPTSTSIDVKEEEVDYLATYIPTLLVSNEKNREFSAKQTEKSLGKWFPKAVTIKQPKEHIFTSGSTTGASNNKSDAKKNNASLPQKAPQAAIMLFYQYIDPVWSEDRVAAVMDFLVRLGHVRTRVAGRIRVAPEGLNCTLSAIDEINLPNDNESGGASVGKSALEALHHVAQDLRRLDPAFQATDFKMIPHLSADRHFAALNIIPVKELVFYGLQDATAPLCKGGTHVSPQDFHRLLGGESLDNDNTEDDGERDSNQKKPAAAAARVETVVIDVRNHYEAALGRFDGQQQTAEEATTSGATSAATATTTTAATAAAATYIDPKMRKSTDFPAWVAAHKDELDGKRVLLYCTGGIRCERASAHLSTAIPNTAAVYQLQGGIERYLQAFPDGGYWRGKNFTFDKREAISAGNWNGDGGVIRKTKKTKSANTTGEASTATTLPECICSVCHVPWDRYVGKKKCSTCGVPVLVCDSCMSDKSKVATARCPLCVEQNVTVRADDVEWTDNGVQAVVVAPSNSSNNTAAPSSTDKQGLPEAPKASTTVLKWGGGHATDKKVKRKWKRTPCRFGTECTRSDCLFQHPT